MDSIIFGICFFWGVILLVIIATVVAYIICKVQDQIIAKREPDTGILLGKLNDSKSEDDINEAVKYMRLTNSCE